MATRTSGLVFVVLLTVGCGEEKTQTPTKAPGGLTSGNATPVKPKPPRLADQGAESTKRTDSPAQKKAHEELAKFKPFPFKFELPDTKGRKIALKDFAGKVVIVDFWGTWCPPCREEIPDFITLYKKYHQSGLEIVGLNYENEKGKEALKLIDDYVKTNAMPYPCLIGDDATQKQVPQFEGYPTTLFVDRNGKVRMMLVGQSELTLLEAFATILLEERPAANH